MTTSLAAGSVARLWSFRHHGDRPHADPAEEAMPSPAMIFTVAGRWTVDSARGRIAATPREVVLLNAGEPYRCTHESHFPTDRTVCLELDAPAGFRFDRASVPFSPRWAHALRRMEAEDRWRGAGHRLAIDALASRLVVDVVRDGHDGGSAPAGVDTARAFLDLNFRRDVGLKDVAAAAATSPFHLAREFKRHVGKTPRQYLIDARLGEARALLRDTTMSVTAVAHACGFNGVSHFVTTFRRRTGLTPLAFRRAGRRSTAIEGMRSG